MSELGQKFKTEREKRGISIQEVGLSLKISPRVIAAIESGDRSSLPAKTFVRGFVKSYAQYLRIDVKEIMDLFQAEFNTEPTLSPIPGTEGESSGPVLPQAVADLASTTKVPSESANLIKENIVEESRFPVGKVIIGIVLFSAVVILAKLVDKYQKERVLPENTEGVVAVETVEVEEKPEDAPLSSAEPAPTGLLSLGTLSHSVASPTSTPITTPTPAPSSTPVATPTPTPKPSPTASPTPSATPTPTPKASPTPTPTPTPTPKPSPSPSPSPSSTPSAGRLSRPLEVIVEATKPVRIRFDLGQGMTTLDLNEGELHTFRSQKPLVMEINDGGALNMIVNGRDRGKAGNAGQSVQLRLTE